MRWQPVIVALVASAGLFVAAVWPLLHGAFCAARPLAAA